MNKAKQMIVGCLGISAVLVLTTGTADARGPKASILSATECSLDLNTAKLVITTTLTNKSSGSTIPELRMLSNIEGTYKPVGRRGNFFKSLGTVNIEELPQDIDPELVVSAEFDLCNDTVPSDEVYKARELNGTATMDYGISGGDDDSRTVPNRCTDNPDTLDVSEGGIKVDDATFAAIETACAAQAQ